MNDKLQRYIVSSEGEFYSDEKGEAVYYDDMIKAYGGTPREIEQKIDWYRREVEAQIAILGEVRLKLENTKLLLDDERLLRRGKK